MHGREDGETRKRIRHMWSVASRSSSATVGVDSGSSSPNSFLKDGRKITVGDCALFKPPNDYPPFIGIIRSLSLDKDSNLKLGVNWLYRPSEVVLGKGVALEAAPNEIFYSFHRDETPAASLLHPCKVAFLPEGVELPSGVSSFVCRRVYDITNNCLWWLTDKDYINDRQEEVDQLLQKPHLEMHGTVQQQGTNSPKSMNGTAATSPLKHSPDNMQNSNTYASDPKGKKRELGDQTSETMKRERLMKDGDSVLSRSESILKSEISKISDKGGLVDYESVEKLVQLMQAEKSQKKADLSCRSMLVGIVASTDRFDSLNQFVQLRGLPVLDEWLQEVHKGKVGDSGIPKDGDKSVEDFLFILLRALDRLPVNLNDLRMCNIGKSVNNLRSHKNLEIQKKSRSLVDAWKKRIELELDINDSKPGSNQPVPFVCRRVYDITNNCLWWLTDKDYINDRQEEVDQVLQKPHLEMHGTVQQQGTNSPKSVNGTAATSPLKHSPDNMQNSNTYASDPKGKKRELGDQTSETMKRERLVKDGDSVLSRSESILKSEISKISDKGGLVDYESVEKLVQLMQAEKSQKKADLSCRSMLVGIVASTDRFDCLNQFVQLRGLPVLDEWLQEVHKGKVGDSGSPKDGDKSVEDFLFVLLRALDRLPVNLNALRMCNIGKSVNNLRSHKNLEIQKKSRSLVDAWKKRIELELNINDSKSGSNQPVPFVCQRVYDITNSCLWWLTDKDYINDRQEEVDQVLQKPHLEMHGTVQQQGTNSPKSVNITAATSLLKHSPDNMQNSNTFASDPKGKKRELGDQTSESMKRERLMKDGDSVFSRSESILKSEISKISDKGGLVDYESVEKLVQLMQAQKSQKEADLSCRSMLVGIVASTERFDCLNQFVQLRGLPVLDEWLQEVHKGKVGDSGSPKDGDKSVEDFLFVLLRALDRLPVNLNALRMCNIGKSVNNLRSHKNLEIQKKSRSLVDAWKKRVELELNINDSKPGSNQPVPWSGRSRHDASHGVNKHPSGSSDTAIRSSGQFGYAKSGSLKPVYGDTTIRAASVPSGSQKITASMSLVTANSKDGQLRILSTGGSSELLHTPLKEEKSSSSSQSHNNSQCSSDQARNIVRSGKEDARSSTAGSKSRNKTAGSSRHRKSANGPQVTAHSGLQKELGYSRNSSPRPSISTSEKFSESTITSENNGSAPVAENNSNKIIVKIPNRGRSPGRIAKTASTEDPSCRNSRASSPAHPEKLDQGDAGLREKNNALQTNETDVTPAVPPDGKQYTSGSGVANGTDVSKGGFQSTEKDADTKRPIDSSKDVDTKRPIDSSMSSMNALIESCVKYSEAHAPIPVGDDSGMNLLASVATGEITRSGASSPGGSPRRNTAMADSSNVDNEGVTLCNDGAPSRPSVSSEDPVQNGDPFLKGNAELDELAGGTSVSVSNACIARRSDEDGGGQILVKAAVINDESHDSVSCMKQIANSHSPPQDGSKDEIRCEERLDKDQEDSLMCPSSSYDEKSNPDRGQNSNVSVEHQQTSLATHPGSAIKEEGQVGDCSIVREEWVLEHCAKQATEITHKVESCSSVPDGVNKRNNQENNASSSLSKEEGSALDSAGFEEKAECNNGTLESKERKAGSYLNSNKSRATTVKGERKDEGGSCTANALSSATVISDTERKLEFDLNEGFNMDDMKNGEAAIMVSAVFSAPVSLFGSSQSAVSASSGPPASVTVASAAKRPFVPPEDLLRNKSERGWKGSAATSAFRPAEPRKVLENQAVSNRAALKEPIASKPDRPFLDIDLNVTDEMDLQDMGSQNSANEIDHNPDRKSGGFELDLNKVDDSPELGHRSTVNFQRLEVSVPPLQSSNGIVIGDINTKRNFDLNDGPAAEESTVESSLYNSYARGNIPPQPTYGLRMNNATVGSLSSWYSPGATYSAVTTPVQLPDISILGAPGTHRVIGAPTTASPFNTDFYRGSVLSSSSAAPFATAPYQYPVFPFGTSFPFPTSSLSGGAAAYMDPSSGGRFCAPAVPTQLLGTAGAVSSQYLRPCVANLPDVNSNGVVESSQKWGRLGLDLNSGPASVDAEGKDEALLIASRQHSAVNSQALMDEQARGYQVAGGVLKRKEPEGGWGTDRLSYRQPSWQ